MSRTKWRGWRRITPYGIDTEALVLVLGRAVQLGWTYHEQRVKVCKGTNIPRWATHYKKVVLPEYTEKDE